MVVEGAWTRCWSCNQTHLQVSRPARLVVSISLYDIPGPLHTVLRKYKDGWSESVREPLGMQVSATLGRFLRTHESCLADGDAFEMVTIVPSRKRADPHPLESAVGRVRSLADRFERTLEPGSVEVGHNRANDRGFDVVADVRGLRVLLVDDTFTSGGALQSAGRLYIWRERTTSRRSWLAACSSPTTATRRGRSGLLCPSRTSHSTDAAWSSIRRGRGPRQHERP